MFRILSWRYWQDAFFRRRFFIALDRQLRAATEAPFRAMNPTGSVFIRDGITPFQPEQSFSARARNFKSRGERISFGRGFAYGQDRLDDQRNFVNSRQCFFNDFFRANGAPELISLFCPIDHRLLDELGKPKYRVRAERPTALGFGEDMCRFQFTRSNYEE